MKIAIAFFVSMSLSAIADNPTSCAAIKANPERLACFDRAVKTQSREAVAVPHASHESVSPRPMPALELKGLRVGMTIKEVEAIHPDLAKECDERRPLPSGSIVCFVTPSSYPNPQSKYPEMSSFAGQSVKSFAILKRDGMLELVRLSVYNAKAAASWLVVTSALAEKFGQPTSTKKGAIQSRTGASFDQEELLWRDGDNVLTATMRGDSVDYMTVELTSEQARQRALDGVKDNAKGNAKDL